MKIGTKKIWVDNFKRAVMEAKHVNEISPDDVLWKKSSKVLLKNPDPPLKNTDKRKSQVSSQAKFVHEELSAIQQMLYHRFVLELHTVYPITAGTSYILLMVQKTMFSLYIIPKTILPQVIENRFNLGDFRKTKSYDQKAYKPPSLSRLMYLQRRASNLWKKSPGLPPRYSYTPVASLQNILPDQPVSQPPEQIQLPDPPLVDTLEPTVADDASLDQLMPSVFGESTEYTDQVIQSRSLPCFARVDNFKTGLVMEQRETSMYLDIPRLNKRGRTTSGFKL
ncbi:hypothetical protein TNCV_1050831 [Trichonephila clavipes]|nr:hypothetical protein TNCV_1050831 [Trichonephila clavipes]